ncbi:RCC1 domain-containing protein [Acrocarpospora catenulata]|uniref:RCC1 domain-containing protein n=1 Tax=Acrocarpospora catenulata TaxID=2836182 RepID=UPI001BDB318D|nr:hypothetical protein [Acrocarpospora catenulata]
MKFLRAVIAFAVTATLFVPMSPARADLIAPQTHSWGANGQASLGAGFSSPPHDPVQVIGGETYTKVATGVNYTVALDRDGRVWHWGKFFTHTAPGSVIIFTPQRFGELDNVVDIAAGESFGVALRSDGTVWTWGENDTGQLGLGTSSRRIAPTQVTSLPPITKVFASSKHAFAIDHGGRTWAWGRNTNGQLGDGTTITRWYPVAIIQGGITAIAAGEFHTVALAGGTAELFSWGRNISGELGDGTKTQRTRPVKVLGNLYGVTAIAAGGQHSLALLSSGHVMGWGSNASYQLNTWSVQESLSPRWMYELADVDAIAASTQSSFAIRNGRIYSLGNATYCMLGSCAITQQQMSPFLVPGLTGVQAISASPLGVFVLRDAAVSAGIVAERTDVRLNDSVLVTNNTAEERTFTVSGLPDGVKATVDPAVVPSKGDTKITLTGDSRTEGAVPIRVDASVEKDPDRTESLSLLLTLS